MIKDEFLFPLIYLGKPEVKDAAELLNTPNPLLFRKGPLSEVPGPLFGQKYADVSEKQGRTLVKRFPDLWAWPEGTELGPQLVTVEQYQAMLARLDALEAAVSALTPKRAKAAPLEKEAPIAVA